MYQALTFCDQFRISIYSFRVQLFINAVRLKKNTESNTEHTHDSVISSSMIERLLLLVHYNLSVR